MPREKDPWQKAERVPASCDTPPEIEEMLVDGYARMSPAERLRRVCALNRLADEMAAAAIRNRSGPVLPGRELSLRLASLRLDRDTMIRAFAWDPETEGY